jgi:hypothetical protein
MRSRLVVFVLLLSATAPAQRFAPLNLDQMSRKAGLIFAGTVTRVERVDAEVPELRTTFRVSKAVRGARAGQTITLRQWISPLDTPEYRPGQNVFLFVHRPGAGGLTSTVGGAAGRFAADPRWNIVLRPEQAALLPLPKASFDRRPVRRVVPYRVFARALRQPEAR